MIHNKFRYLMTLALLLTAATGAWADETPLVTITASSDFQSGSKTFDNIATVTLDGNFFGSTAWDGNGTITVTPANDGVTITSVKFSSNNSTIEDTTAPFQASQAYDSNVSHDVFDVDGNKGHWPVAKIEVYGTAEPPIEVNPVAQPAANTKQWTFTQPGSNVVLTPRYASATIYDADGETEKQAYETLKEAIQNVQNGETIKLDWDVTVSEPLTTPNRGDNDPISFTLDLNGYILDAESTVEYVINLNNGDEMTISNIRDDKLGGIKGNVIATNNSHIIFDCGRYLFSQSSTAEAIQQGWSDAVQNYGWQMAEGKEFVNVNNGSADNQGFLVRVDYVPFELTIGAGRFATFYDTHNITMIEENQNISFYTIKSGDIDLENNVAKVTKVESDIIPAGLPLLVYNGGEQQQTVKLKVTTTEATPIQDIAIEFVGTASGREFDDEVMAVADYYALSGGKMFVPVYETGNIAPHKCWLQFLKQQGGARTITIVFDDATAISTVSGSPADTGDIYDLQGRKVQKPARKGVFIQNGKKVVK